MRHPGVEPTNNAAEQTIRFVVLDRAVTQGTRGCKGREWSERIWTAAVLVIGDEILSGRTQDKNVAQIATWLDVQGIRLREVRIVPDVEAEIVDALNAVRARYDYMRAQEEYGDDSFTAEIGAEAAAED